MFRVQITRYILLNFLFFYIRTTKKRNYKSGFFSEYVQITTGINFRGFDKKTRETAKVSSFKVHCNLRDEENVSQKFTVMLHFIFHIGNIFSNNSNGWPLNSLKRFLGMFRTFAEIRIPSLRTEIIIINKKAVSCIYVFILFPIL